MIPLTFIDLFAGIGGFSLGFTRAGMQCVAQVEIDEFCQRVLQKNFPDVPKFKDVRNVGKHNLPAADVICGGFPCQPHSYAGKRKGKDDDRNLWPEYLRVIDELKPRYVIGENVPGIITTILDEVLSDLEGRGYTCQTFVIPAGAFNAPHWRDRVWIIAHSNGDGCTHGEYAINTAESRKYAQRDVTASRGNASYPNGAGLEGSNKLQRSIRPTARDWNWNWIEVATRLCGMDDGLPVRLDGFELSRSKHREHRLKALGNAIVPNVAEFIGTQLMSHL